MNPLPAALIAAGYMAGVFLIFGFGGRFVGKSH
jgi:hypothetical protein